MNKVSVIFKTLFVLVLVSSLTLGQYETQTDTTQRGTEQGTQTDEGMRNGDQDNNILGQEDDTFRPTAMTLAQDLQSRLTLTNDQVEEITDILVDYKNEIADIKRDKSDEMRASREDGTTDTGTTGTGTTRTESDRTDVAESDTGDAGLTDDNEMIGGRTDYTEKFREADVSANEDIEGVLEKEQLARYIQIKRDWWDTVKERVHTEAANQNQMENNDTDSGIMNNNNNKE